MNEFQKPKPQECLAAAMVLGLPYLICWLAFANLGGFPSNDDPFYGRPAQILADESRFQVIRQTGQLSASSTAHVLIGAGFSKLMGFSYRTLFLAVMGQLWLAAVAVFDMTRCAGHAWPISLFWAALFLFNPLVFGHGFTFMTDGPAMAWGVFAIWCFLKGLRNSSCQWLVSGSLAVGVAFWMRQTHAIFIAIPCTAICVLWLQGRLSGTHSAAVTAADADTAPTIKLWRSLLATTLPLAAAILLFESGWIVFGDDGRLGTVVGPRIDPVQLVRNIYGLGLLIGFLTLPALPALFNSLFSKRSERVAAVSVYAGILVSALLLLPLLATQGRACLTSATGTFIQNAHYGPIFLSDFEMPERWGDMGGVQWNALVWQFLSLLSLINSGLLTSYAVHGGRAWIGVLLKFVRAVLLLVSPTRVLPSQSDGQHRVADTVGVRFGADLSVSSAATLGMLVMAVAAVMVVLSVSTGVLDRYWMLLLPLVFAGLPLMATVEIYRHRRGTAVVSTGLLALQLCLTVVFVHDFLSWNQIRWNQVQKWLAEGHAAQDIDAGRDINAWYRSAEDPDTMPRPGDTSSWWSGHATLSLSIGPREGWETIDRLKWKSWATLRKHEILVLRRTRG